MSSILEMDDISHFIHVPSHKNFSENDHFKIISYSRKRISLYKKFSESDYFKSKLSELKKALSERNIVYLNFLIENLETSILDFVDFVDSVWYDLIYDKDKSIKYQNLDFILKNNIISNPGIILIVVINIIDEDRKYSCEHYYFTDIREFMELKTYEIVKYLIKNSIEHPNINGSTFEPTALYYAVEDNNLEMVKFLVENGATIWIIDSSNIKDFDDSPAFKGNIEYFEVFEYLFNNYIESRYHNTGEIALKKEDSCICKEYEKLKILKSKKRSDLLREELIAKYHSPENIEKWSIYFNKPFDEVLEVI